MNYSVQPLNPSSNLAIVVNSCSLSWGKYADSGTFSAYLKRKKNIYINFTEEISSRPPYKTNLILNFHTT